MPGDFRCDRGDYARVPFSFGPEAAGALGARHSLRPLISEGQTFLQNLGRLAPRDRGVISEFAATSLREAKRRSNPHLLRGNMDCFTEPVIGRAFARPVGSTR